MDWNRFSLLSFVALFAAAGAHAKVTAIGTIGSDPANSISFGDGIDGEFNNGPTQTGITVSGTTITIDTSVKANFAFTNFTLSSGYTINTTGANPLVIRVSGQTSIAGTLSLNGQAGTSVGASTSTASGGTAGAGGGSGGAGASSSGTSSVDGTSPSAVTLGGGHGTNGNGGSQKAGGGGCNGTGATTGYLGTAGACTLSQAATAAQFETNFYGGGGGGGGGRTSTGPVAGGAGGGGGGALRMISLLDVTIAGSVTATGGQGGDTFLNGDCGAAGGGGSGGSIWIQSAGTVTVSGTINVTKGSGGPDAACAGSYFGGNGSRGVVRVDSAGLTVTGSVTPAGSVDASNAVAIDYVDVELEGGLVCGSLALSQNGSPPQGRPPLGGVVNFSITIFLMLVFKAVSDRLASTARFASWSGRPDSSLERTSGSS